MAPRVDPVGADTALPPRADVVIVGGGIAGTCTALSLAEKGVSVALCEKGHIAGEQSSRNWGWCRKQGRDPREIPLIIEAMRQWQGMNERVGAETGFRQTGILYLGTDAAELRRYEDWLGHAKPYQLDSRLLSGAEIAALVPQTSRRWAGGLYTASDGRAEPQKAAPAIAEAARRRGAAVLTGCAVRGIETSGGRVSAVITEKGPIACGSVVLAGGAWSSLFCRSLGIRLPQLKVLASVQRTVPVEGGPEAAAYGPDFALRKRLDGGYSIAPGGTTIVDIVPDSFRFFADFLPVLRLEWQGLRFRVGKRFLDEARLKQRWALDEVSPFEAVRVLDPEPATGLLDAAMKNVARDFPMFGNVGVVERWAGLIDATPDAVPVISGIDALPGLFVATGFSGHGFGIGPGAGRLMAELVTGATPVVDATPFRFSRFTDGSRPRPMTGL
jgi:glycine/D-amino acid oxidase-like deaminating enzyme